MKNKYSFTNSNNSKIQIKVLTEKKADGSFQATIFHFSDSGKQTSDEGRNAMTKFSSNMIYANTEKEVLEKCRKMIVETYPGNYELNKIELE